MFDTKIFYSVFENIHHTDNNFVPVFSRRRSTFSFTRQSTALLERVAVCVSNSEPVLLVGETGTGKTSSVQYLAEQLGKTFNYA